MYDCQACARGVLDCTADSPILRGLFFARSLVSATGNVSCREIADDPHGFILRQGWASLDFSEEAGLSQLWLHEMLQLEFITVIQALGRLRESPDCELSKSAR